MIFAISRKKRLITQQSLKVIGTFYTIRKPYFKQQSYSLKKERLDLHMEALLSQITATTHLQS